MKKSLALILALLLALSAPLALAEPLAGGEQAAAPAPANYEELVVGSTTAMSGNFFSDMFGSNTADMDVRTLLHGYNLIQWNGETGAYGIDDSVVSGLIVTDDGAGNRTYTVALYDDLSYSDGTPITAYDYAFSLLLSVAPEVAEIGGSTGKDYLLGVDEYLDGTAAALAGVRVLAEDQLAITVKAEYLPYFYELTMMDVTPYPIAVIAPGCEVADDGEGAYIRNIDETVEEPIFTAALLEETLLNPETGYISHPGVTSGPYRLTAYDAANSTAEFEINENYKGNSDGELPQIPRLVFRLVTNEDMIAQLESGEIGLINKAMNADTVDAGMRLVTGGTAGVSNYARSGYGFISYNCERPGMDSAAVRQAIAHCLDKDAFIADYVRNYGLRVDGYYGIGQWMYRLVSGALAAPVEAPAEDADEAAVAEYEAEVAEWEALNLSGIEMYALDTDAAAELLDADGWNLNREGEAFTAGEDDVRCKEIEGEIVPLEFTMIYPEGNTAAESLQATFADNLKRAGIALTMEPKPFAELLQIYYRQVERDCDMVFLATNFGDVFEPSATFNPAEALQGVHNRTGVADEELYNLALEMRATEPGDVLGYCQKWVAFQERWTEVMPTLPIYSNVYFDFYTPTLHNYNAGADTSWAEAIVGAYLGDVEAEVEAEPIGDDTAVFID